jgi:hypothetical protein
MKLTSPFSRLITSILLAVALTGCASNQGAQHKGHTSDAATSKAPESMGGVPAGNQLSMMDMKTMCDRHTRMMSGKTPDEKKMMLDQHMKAMSPEMRQKHMAMMEKCS